MCGIAGIVDLGPDSPDPDLIREMVSRLWHRGPDGWGWYRDADAALGHARLAILDIGGRGFDQDVSHALSNKLRGGPARVPKALQCRGPLARR